MHPEISVIIPAYNAATYLKDCLESIARQSFRDFEVITVDDGSTDSTGAIAREFSRSDGRFKVITSANGGVSRARNTGMEAATGEFITFADADDLMHPRALESMLALLKEERADVCVASFKSVDADFILSDTEAPQGNGGRMEVYDYPGAMRAALYQKRLMNSPWGMMIRRSTVGPERFREGVRYEDLDAFYRFFEGAGRIVYTPDILYYYRDNPGSFLHRWSDARLDVLEVTDRMEAFFRERYPDLARAAADRRFSAHFNMLLLMLRNGIVNPAALGKCREVVHGGRKRALSDPDVRLKNKLGALLSFGGDGMLRLLSRKYPRYNIPDHAPQANK